MSRKKNKRSTLPKEFEEQKRLHHWILDAKSCVPIPSRAQTSQDPQAFCLILRHVGGLQVPEPLQDIDPHISFRVSLFDLGTRQFFGNTWCSEPGHLQGSKRRGRCRVTASGNLDVPNFEMPVYLYTHISDPNCAAVVEIVISDIDEASGMIVHSYGIGWSVVKFFGSGKNASGATKVSLPIYSGTPRSLLLLPTNAHRWDEAQEALEYNGKATLSVESLYYESLLSCIHLLSSNVLVSSQDRIPGLKGKRSTLPDRPIVRNRKGDDDGNKLNLKKLKLLKRSTLKISGIKILMPFGFDERFEDDVTSIAELALEKSERTNWEISDRWLDIGVHNSKRFVPMKDSKDEWLRIPLQHGGNSRKASVDGFYLKERHRKTHRLTQFVNHPSFAVVAMLCYKARRVRTGRSRRRGTSVSGGDEDTKDDSNATTPSEIVFQVASCIFLPVKSSGKLQIKGYFDRLSPNQEHILKKGLSDFDAKKGDTGRPLEIWMLPSNAMLNFAPTRDVYDGWVGNGRVIMLGAQMRGKGRQDVQYSESDSEKDTDSADDEWTSEDSISSSSSSSSDQEVLDDDDDDDKDISRMPSWLRVGTRVEVCHKKNRWQPGVVIEIHEHQRKISLDCRLVSGIVAKRVPLSRIRRVRGKDGGDGSSIVSSVNTEYVRDMTLRMKALKDGRELPPELAMAANALKLRLHGKNDSGDNKVLVPSVKQDSNVIMNPSSFGRSRPLTRETSTQLSQFGFRHARSSGTLRRSKDELRTSYGYWKGTGSPLLSVPSELRGAVSAAVSSPYKRHCVTIQFAAWRSVKYVPTPSAVTLQLSFYDAPSTRTAPLQLLYTRRGGIGGESKQYDSSNSDTESGYEEEDDSRQQAKSKEKLWVLVPQGRRHDEESKTAIAPRISVKRRTTQQEGCTLSFEFDTGSGGVSEAWNFHTYLATKTAYVEIWDSESLLPLGSAAIPLKGLLRGGKKKISMALEVDVTSTNRSTTADSLQGMSGVVVGRLQVLAKSEGTETRAADNTDWSLMGPRAKQPAASASALLLAPSKQSWGAPTSDAKKKMQRPNIRVRARALKSSSKKQMLMIENKKKKTVSTISSIQDTTCLSRDETTSVIAALGVAGGGVKSLRQSWVTSRPIAIRQEDFLSFAMGTGSEALRSAMWWVSTCATEFESTLVKMDKSGLGLISRDSFLYEAHRLGDGSSGNQDTKSKNENNNKPTRQELSVLTSEFETSRGVRYVDMLRVCGAVPSTTNRLRKWFEKLKRENKKKDSTEISESLRRRLTQRLATDGSGIASIADVRRVLSNMGLSLRGPNWEVVVRLLRTDRSGGLNFNGIVDLASGRAECTGNARLKLRNALERFLGTGKTLRDLFGTEGIPSNLFALLTTLGLSVMSSSGLDDRTNALATRQLARLDAIPGRSDEEEDNDPEEISRLEQIRKYRAQRKRLVGEKLLRDALSWEHHVRVSFGRVCFFEFPFTSPVDHEERFRIHFEDSELRLITDANEWRAYRRSNAHLILDDEDEDNDDDVVEENMFARAGRSFEFVLAAGEQVKIPFVLCAISQDSATTPYSSSLSSNKSLCRQISVNFECTSTARTAVVLDLHAHLARPTVHRVLRLHVPESSFLRRRLCLRVPGGSKGLFVHCPNRDVSVECEAPETYHDGMDASSDLVQHVTLKYHCGMWPSTADFFLAFYADKYQTRLWEVWRVVIHSMRVVDTRAMLGQASNADLLLALSEGYDRNRRRLVQCFASDPLRVKFRPAGVFSMSANAITKTSLSFVPRRSGDLELQVHAVDVESRSLVGAWIVRASVSAPPVTKTFDVELSTGTQSTKRVVFENQWDTTRIFVVTTNDSDRIRIKTPRLAMSAKGRNYLRLEFVPRDVVEAAEAFVFVSGQDGQIEECILFRLNYVL